MSRCPDQKVLTENFLSRGRYSYREHTTKQIPTAWDFFVRVLDGGMFFQQKKQLSQGREIL
jgi:hypothetical protein